MFSSTFPTNAVETLSGSFNVRSFSRRQRGKVTPCGVLLAHIKNGEIFGSNIKQQREAVASRCCFIARPKRAKRATKAQKAVVPKVGLRLKTAVEYYRYFAALSMTIFLVLVSRVLPLQVARSINSHRQHSLSSLTS